MDKQLYIKIDALMAALCYSAFAGVLGLGTFLVFFKTGFDVFFSIVMGGVVASALTYTFSNYLNNYYDDKFTRAKYGMTKDEFLLMKHPKIISEWENFKMQMTQIDKLSSFKKLKK